MIIYLFNFLLYLFYTISLRRRKASTLSLLSSILYLILSLCSLLMFNDYGNNENPILGFASFIYLFVFLSAFINILSKTSVYPHKEICNNDGALRYFYVFCLVSVIIRMPEMIQNFSNAVTMVMLDSNYLYDTYNEQMDAFNSTNRGSFHFLTIIMGMFDRYVPFFLAYYLSKNDRNNIILAILIISFAVTPIYGLCNSQRGAIMLSILSLISAILIFYNSYTPRIKKITQRMCGALIGLCLLGFSLITISRFTQSYMDDNSGFTSVVNYGGQTMINFSDYGFSPNDCRWGDRTIPLVKSLIISGGAYDYAHRMAKYKNLNLHEGIFSTFIGDLIADWGVIITTVLLLIMISLFKRSINSGNNSLHLYNLFAIYLLSYFILCGWNLYPFADYGGNLSLIVGILIYIGLKKNNI